MAIPVDGEARYYMARTFARLEVHDRAADEMRRVIDGGFWCYEAFQRDPWLDAIREMPSMTGPLDQARAHADRAKALFNRAGGTDLLALTAAGAMEDQD